MLVLLIVTLVSAGCLMGIPIGYIVPEVYDKNFVPTPTVTPTPSTIFVPVDITLEELRAKETVTAQEIASVYLSTAEQNISIQAINQVLTGKKLQAFDGTIAVIYVGDSDCAIIVDIDDYPGAGCSATISDGFCASVGINSKVIMSGTIEKVLTGGRLFGATLTDVALSVR